MAPGHRTIRAVVGALVLLQAMDFGLTVEAAPQRLPEHIRRSVETVAEAGRHHLYVRQNASSDNGTDGSSSSSAGTTETTSQASTTESSTWGSSTPMSGDKLASSDFENSLIVGQYRIKPGGPIMRGLPDAGSDSFHLPGRPAPDSGLPSTGASGNTSGGYGNGAQDRGNVSHEYGVDLGSVNNQTQQGQGDYGSQGYGSQGSNQAASESQQDNDRDGYKHQGYGQQSFADDTLIQTVSSFDDSYVTPTPTPTPTPTTSARAVGTEDCNCEITSTTWVSPPITTDGTSGGYGQYSSHSDRCEGICSDYNNASNETPSATTSNLAAITDPADLPNGLIRPFTIPDAMMQARSASEAQATATPTSDPVGFGYNMVSNDSSYDSSDVVGTSTSTSTSTSTDADITSTSTSIDDASTMDFGTDNRYDHIIATTPQSNESLTTTGKFDPETSAAAAVASPSTYIGDRGNIYTASSDNAEKYGNGSPSESIAAVTETSAAGALSTETPEDMILPDRYGDGDSPISSDESQQVSESSSQWDTEYVPASTSSYDSAASFSTPFASTDSSWWASPTSEASSIVGYETAEMMSNSGYVTPLPSWTSAATGKATSEAKKNNGVSQATVSKFTMMGMSALAVLVAFI